MIKTDSGGVIYFANTFKIAHNFIEHFIIDKGIPWKTWFDHQDWAAPIKQAHCNYTSPLFAGQECVGKVLIKKTSHCSITFETQIQQNHKLCAIVETLHVFVDLKKLQKRPLPEVIKSKLESPPN